MSTYDKPYLTFKEQLQLLKFRGLDVLDDNRALEYLARIGYYRLSGYWYPSRELIQSTVSRKDIFMKGAKFQDAVDLYVFDKKLRLLLLDALERIEVAFRVDIAYVLGAKDKFAYENPSLLHGNFTKKINPKTGKTRYQEWLDKHKKMITRSKEDFVEHFKKKYGSPLPIWVAIELWDFGLLSTFYKGMAVKDKAEIAAKYHIPDWQVMESWLRCLNYVRNVVAHHSRLWNRNLVDQPKLPKKGAMPAFDSLIGNIHSSSRVYIVLKILAHFMKCVCPRSSWQKRLIHLIHLFPTTDYVKLKDMGFPDEWESDPCWKN